MASCHLKELWRCPEDELIREVLALAEEKDWREFVCWGVCVCVQSAQPFLSFLQSLGLPLPQPASLHV